MQVPLGLHTPCNQFPLHEWTGQTKYRRLHRYIVRDRPYLEMYALCMR